MHMKQLKMLFQVIQISSLNKGVLNSYKKCNKKNMRVLMYAIYLEKKKLEENYKNLHKTIQKST